MTIRQLNIENFDLMIEIFKKHDKFQRLPKRSARIDINNPSDNIDSYFERIWREDLENEWSTWFGKFNHEDELTGFIRCKLWKNSKNDNYCTIGAIVKNKSVIHNYTHGQPYFPDDIIDLYNHCVLFAESNSVKAIYNFRNASYSNDHEQRWVPIVEIPECLLSKYDVEELCGIYPHHRPTYFDNTITNTEFVSYVFGVYFSTIQKAFRFTKP